MNARWKFPLRFIVASFAIGVLVFTVGSCQRPPTAQPDPGTPARVVRVSPSKLFTGDLDRLEPHLNLTASGCVRLDAPDDTLFVGFEPEVWELGKPPRTLGSSLSRAEKPNEASFSLREATDSKGQRVYQLVAAVVGPSGRSSSSFDVAIPDEPIKMSSTAELSEPRELAEGENVPVWAFVAHTDVRPDRGTLEEAVKAAHWALVIKVRWEPTKGR